MLLIHSARIKWWTVSWGKLRHRRRISMKGICRGMTTLTWTSYLLIRLMVLIHNSIQTSVLRIRLYHLRMLMWRLHQVRIRKLAWVNLEGRWDNIISNPNKPSVSVWTLKVPNDQLQTNRSHPNWNSHKINQSWPKITTAFPCQITITASGTASSCSTSLQWRRIFCHLRETVAPVLTLEWTPGLKRVLKTSLRRRLQIWNRIWNNWMIRNTRRLKRSRRKHLISLVRKQVRKRVLTITTL